jgi:hypothetical protein
MTRIDFQSGFRMLFTIVVLGFALPRSVIAQRESGATRIPVAKGSGDIETVRRPDPPAAPPSLSMDQLRQLIGPIGAALSSAQGPWKVTPSSPLTSKVRISFIEAHVLLPAANFAAIHGESPGAVMLQIRPSAAGEQHVIDCMVAPPTPGYRIKGVGGFTQTFNNTNHLTFVHSSSDGQAAAFKIERAFSVDEWYFFGCDVKLLQ